jgi:hypothetical protein
LLLHAGQMRRETSAPTRAPTAAATPTAIQGFSRT